MTSYGQFLQNGEIHGNFYVKSQVYNSDSAIGAKEVDEKARMNAFGNINYTNGDFSAGMRYEAYYNALLGYDENYKGSGITYKYASYKKDNLEITLGNFYEQFGMGFIFRTFEDQALGYDNAMEGVRVKFKPHKSITIKAIYGKQRSFFDLGEGIVRGIDGELFVNDVINSFKEKKTQITIGGGFVSKYQADEDPIYILPENIGAFAGRINVSRGKINFYSEYAYKINDPSKDNSYIFKNGSASLLQVSYSQKGFSTFLSGKRIDNMSYRSDRNAVFNSLQINYIPTFTKNHAYSLASIYPYATQANGEFELQAEIQYKIKKGSLIGGKYGIFLTAHFTKVNSLKTTKKFDGTGYESEFFALGNDTYFQDANLELKKKINKKWKGTIKYLNLIYNKNIIEGGAGYDDIHSHIAIADVTYKIKKKNTLRFEVQHLATKQDHGNWIAGLLEYTIAPKWFFTIYDDFNYGNIGDKLHYPNVIVTYAKNASRIGLAYGRNKEGINCAGGICTFIPAYNGLSITISTNF